MKLSGLENAHSCPLFSAGDITGKVGQTDLVLVCDQGSVVGVHTQDYKSLCAAVTIYGTCLTSRHAQTDRKTAF